MRRLHAILDMAGNVISNLADGVAATDAATVKQLRTYETTGLLVPTPGSWQDYGSLWAGLNITKHSGMVTIEALLGPTSNLSVTAGQQIIIATIPAGLRPTHTLMTQQHCSMGTSRVDIAPGNVQWFTPAAGTFPTTGYLAVVCTYRQGS